MPFNGADVTAIAEDRAGSAESPFGLGVFRGFAR